MAALKAVKKVSRCKIVGVTTLTSLNNKDLKTIGYDRSVKSLVAHQAKLASKARLDALVCSPYEVNIVRKILKKRSLLLVCKSEKEIMIKNVLWKPKM